MATYEFRVTRIQNAEFNQLLEELLDEQEWSEQYMVLLDQIKCLPGWPIQANWEVDTIEVTVVDVPRVFHMDTASSIPN